MPALSNAKHERFAQELAKGKTQAEAYAEAGYTGDRTAASRLSTNVNVQTRVAELQSGAAKRTEMTVASLTRRLDHIAQIALKTGVATDPETGAVATSSSKHLNVARAAIMDAAKLNGLIVDKAVVAETTLEEMLDSLDGASGEPEAA